MDNMEYIDDYFKSSPTEEQKQQFEQRIINDIPFAEDVAFYISASGVIQEQVHIEKKQWFREIYAQQKTTPVVKMPLRNVIRYLAAASIVVAVILLTWLLPGNKSSLQQFAASYTQENLQKIDVTMGTNPDSLKSGINFYNDRKFSEALNRFEEILKNDSANSTAKKYAGMAALKLKKYDVALDYFSRLAADSSLYSNFGKFYQAITLLDRNTAGDEAAAKKLLEEVKESDHLEGKLQAEEWLK